MRDCEHLRKCPIFNRFKLEGIRNFWVGLYCQGDRQSRCYRKELKAAGKYVPESMLPNGEFLSTGILSLGSGNEG